VRAGKKYLHLGTRAVSTFSSHSRTVSAQQTQAPGLDEETVTRLRADTPGLEGFVERTPEAVAHFNNAGSSLPPKSVLDAQLEYLEREAVAGGYETVEERAVDLQRPYVAIAALLNCDPSEIAIGQSATSMWQAAFGCFDFRPGDRILTARAEYASNAIAYLQAAERTGAVVEFVPCDERGQLDALELERTIADETKGPVRLVSVTHVPTSGGLVNPASAIGAVTS
jgi:selenocysteine lyase/cysteine desulfurase